MNVLVVDDNEINLEVAIINVKNALPDAMVYSFTLPLEALKLMDKVRFELAFLDIEMPVMNGIELAKNLKLRQPKSKILFYTSHTQYAYDAFKAHASGYLLKGATSEEIRKEIANLNLKPVSDDNSKLVVKCFGKFDCFYQNKIVKFERARAKELFAFLCIHGGKSCTLNDIEAALFEGDEFSQSHLKQIHVFYASLVKSLGAIGLEGILVKSRNAYAVDVTRIQCDYLDYVDGKVMAINEYNGDFLPDYEWAFM